MPEERREPLFCMRCGREDVRRFVDLPNGSRFCECGGLRFSSQPPTLLVRPPKVPLGVVIEKPEYAEPKVPYVLTPEDKLFLFRNGIMRADEAFEEAA